MMFRIILPNRRIITRQSQKSQPLFSVFSTVIPIDLVHSNKATFTYNGIPVKTGETPYDLDMRDDDLIKLVY